MDRQTIIGYKSQFDAIAHYIESDDGKEQVAFAQSYFAVQTRKAELIEERLDDHVDDRVPA